jgi:hypothetical protein
MQARTLALQSKVPHFPQINMHNDLIQKISDLMNEQASAYTRLESATAQLSAALVRGEPEMIESLSRTGETELTRMRSRLLEITSLLTDFAELRAREEEKKPLEPSVRDAFDAAARDLLDAARQFQKISNRVANLAVNGSTFASACIQNCGVSPSTYRAPILKYSTGGAR